MIRLTCKTCNRKADYPERPRDAVCGWCWGKATVSEVEREPVRANVR